MNTAYKHLDAKLRVAELSVPQWLGVLLGLGMAIGWGVYLSPLGPGLTLVISVYMAALPIAAALFSSLTEFNPWRVVGAAIRWHRREGRYLPGSGDRVQGYTVRIADAGRDAGQDGATVPDLSELWEVS